MKASNLTTLLLLAIATQLHAAELQVTNTNDSGPGSLRQRIADAPSGDTILFNIPASGNGYDPATGVHTIGLTTGELLIQQSITIDGSGSKIVVSGTGSSRVFNVTGSPVTIANLTIAEGLSDTVGNILNSGNLTVRGCTVRNGFGGGLRNSGVLTVINSTVTENVGIDAGIRNDSGGFLVLRSSTVTGNQPGFSGSGGHGVTNAGAEARVGNCIIVGNNLATSGDPADVKGSFFSEGHNLIGIRSDINQFFAGGDRPGINAADVNLGPLQDNGGATSTMRPRGGSEAIDQGNRGVDSSGAPNNVDQRGSARPVDQSGIPSLSGGDDSDIGAIEVEVVGIQGSPMIVNTLAEADDDYCTTSHCTLREALNAANVGFVSDEISFASGLSGTIRNSIPDGLPIRRAVKIHGPGARLLTISGNNTARLFNIAPSRTSVTIRDLTLANGRAGGSTFPGNCGGAILNDGDLTLENCTLVKNSSAVHGGAIYNIPGGAPPSVSLSVSNCTFSENSASASGGAIFAAAYGAIGTVFAVNSTFDRNSAADFGGAIYNDGTSNGNAIVNLLDCTLNQNTAALSGGGIVNDGANGDDVGVAKLTLRNTILRTGASGANLENDGGTIESEGHNLSNDAAGGGSGTAPGGFLNVAGDQRNTDPRLASLANNGGPTDTVALLSDSPAIGAGGDNMGWPDTDQRGFSRSGLNDIGAFEFGGVAPTPTPSPTPTATATPTPTPVPTAAKVGNIATRLRVETGTNVLIGGLIITGSQPKRLIVRAIGPSLPDVPGALQNPQLEIYRGEELIGANDNWRDAPNQQEIIDSTVAPANDFESAILATLAPGAYTAVVSGVGGETGVGSVEAYDLDLNGGSSFANIATRGFVQTGADVMIGGLILVGDAPRRVIVRAIGPSLGIGGQLEDPTLELINPEGEPIAFNDNWRDSQAAEIEGTTIPPVHELESAIVASLPASRYTAIVRGVGESVGVALVEVYALE